jgi:hypothetical protein
MKRAMNVYNTNMQFNHISQDDLFDIPEFLSGFHANKETTITPECKQYLYDLTTKYSDYCDIVVSKKHNADLELHGISKLCIDHIKKNKVPLILQPVLVEYDLYIQENMGSTALAMAISEQCERLEELRTDMDTMMDLMKKVIYATQKQKAEVKMLKMELSNLMDSSMQSIEKQKNDLFKYFAEQEQKCANLKVLNDKLCEDRMMFEMQCAEASLMLSNKICDIEQRDKALLETKDELIALCAKKIRKFQRLSVNPFNKSLYGSDDEDSSSDYDFSDNDLLEIYSRLS